MNLENERVESLDFLNGNNMEEYFLEKANFLENLYVRNLLLDTHSIDYYSYYYNLYLFDELLYTICYNIRNKIYDIVLSIVFLSHFEKIYLPDIYSEVYINIGVYTSLKSKKNIVLGNIVVGKDENSNRIHGLSGSDTEDMKVLSSLFIKYIGNLETFGYYPRINYFTRLKSKYINRLDINIPLCMDKTLEKLYNHLNIYLEKTVSINKIYLELDFNGLDKDSRLLVFKELKNYKLIVLMDYLFNFSSCIKLKINYIWDCRDCMIHNKEDLLIFLNDMENHLEYLSAYNLF